MEQVRLAKEELVCSICHEFFTLPKVLECQHSFCEDCLRKCYEHSFSKRPKKGSGTVFACPECRQDSLLPFEGVEALPTNFKLARLVEILSPEQKLTIRNATRRSLRRQASDTVPFCKDHPRKVLEYYCNECRQLVCGSCMLSSHRPHSSSIIESEEALQNHLKTLDSLKVQVNATLQGAENVMDNLAKDIEEIKLNGSRASHRVKTYFSRLREHLVKRERHFLSSLSSELEKPIAGIAEQRSSVRQAMEQIINNLKTLDELSQCKQDVNVLLTEGELVAEVKKNILAMQEVQDAIVKNPILTIVTMPCFEDQEFDKVCQQVGNPSFRTCPPDCKGKRKRNPSPNEQNQSRQSTPSPPLPHRIKPKAPDPSPLPQPTSSTPPPLPPKSPAHGKNHVEQVLQTDVVAPIDSKKETPSGFKSTEDVAPSHSPHNESPPPPPLPPKSPRRIVASSTPSNSGTSTSETPAKRPIPRPRQKKPGDSSPTVPSRRNRAVTIAPNTNTGDVSPDRLSPSPKDNRIRSHTLGSSSPLIIKDSPQSPAFFPSSSPTCPLTLQDIVQPVMMISSKQMMGPMFSRQSKSDHVCPSGVCVGSNGVITVSDLKNHCVRMVASSGKFLDYIGTEGTGEGQLRDPSAVAVDTTGNIFVVDRTSLTVQKFSETGQFMSKLVPKGLRPSPITDPRGVAVTHDDRVLVADAEKLCIHVFDSTGKLLNQFGPSLESSISFMQPAGITVDYRGRVLVTDRGNHMVWVYTPDGEYLSRFGFQGQGYGDLYNPCGVAVDSQGRIFVSESDNHRISVFSSNGDFICCFGMQGSEPGMFQAPRHICVDKNDRLIVADECNNRLQVFDVQDILNDAI